MTDKNYTPPEFSKELFTCPHCHLHTRHEWFPLKYSEKNYDKEQSYKYVQLSGIAYVSIGKDHGTDPMISQRPLYTDIRDHDVDLRNTDPHSRKAFLWASKCQECFRDCIWGKGDLIYPDVSVADFSDAPLPNEDLPQKIKEIYDEAASIMQKSPRAAAALLRLAVEEICALVKCKGDTLKKNIDHLFETKKISKDIYKSMDMVRIVGNNAVHPGIINFYDNAETVKALFNLVNRIADLLIIAPRENSAIYDSLPETEQQKHKPKQKE